MNLELELNDKAVDTLLRLQLHFKVADFAAVIKKALAVLQLVQKVHESGGELYTSKGRKKKRIIVE